MKATICDICRTEISSSDKYIKAKRNMIFYDKDGKWCNFKRILICSNCIDAVNQLREMTNNE